MTRSKIHSVPGVPAVIATVGAWYEGWIDSWIDDHPIDPSTFSVPEFAKEFAADYFAFHDPRARARLAECGLTLPDELKPNTPERLAASAQVIIAGVQMNWSRAQLWTADYPNVEPQPAHYQIKETNGRMERLELVSVHVAGNFDHLAPLIESFNANVNREQSHRVVECVLDIRERLGRTEDPIPVRGPFDIVCLTRGGIEWLQGREGALEADRVYAVAFDAQGNLKSTQSMKHMAVSVPVVSSSGITYTSSTGTSSTGDSTIEFYWDGTNGSVVPQVHFPSDTYDTWTTCVSGNSGTLSGFNASHTYYFMARIDAQTLAVTVQQQQGGSTANGVDHQWLNADGYVGFAINMACSTPAVNSTSSGTPSGGGGGGTSCPSVEQIIETKRGYIKAGEIIPGDCVRDPDGDWNEVFFAENHAAQIVGVTIDGEELRVDSQHLWLNPDNEWIGTTDLHLGSVLQGADNSLYAVEGLRVLGLGMMRKLKVNRQRFVVGRVVGHNAITL
jgi:hypothetical protein